MSLYLVECFCCLAMAKVEGGEPVKPFVGLEDSVFVAAFFTQCALVVSMVHVELRESGRP